MKGIQIRFLIKVFIPLKGTFVLSYWVRREILYRFARFTQSIGTSKVLKFNALFYIISS
jgi:hypothetical protein